MEWHELRVETTSFASEWVANVLIMAGSNGVSIEDPLDLETLDDGFGQLKPAVEALYDSQEVYVSGFFPHTKNIIEIKSDVLTKLEEVKASGLDVGTLAVNVVKVSEEDWENAWKQYYHPVRVSRFLTIVPEWEDYSQQESEKIISLDPGMAFGTGTHPTTRLSIEALEMIVRGKEHVLDVGTGSGVLAIAAKALGAGCVEAFDLDEKATGIAKENILLNDYAKDIQVFENDLLVGVDRQADIIVANILAEILERLVPDAFRNLKTGGYFILAGIILAKRDPLVHQLIEQGFTIEQENRMGEWVSLICKKVDESV